MAGREREPEVMRSLTVTAVTVLVLVGFICVGALAAEHHVPGDFETIQAAIEVAAGGDTVVVAPGTYVEDIDFLGKDISVEGVEGARATTIEGTGTGPVVSFVGGEPSSAFLVGFTIRGGAGREYGGERCGGGVFILGSSPTLSGNIICENSASGLEGEHAQAAIGGGIYAFSSGARLIGNEVTDNVAQGGYSPGWPSTYGSGGDACGGGIAAIDSELILEGNVISGNAARGGRDASYWDGDIIGGPLAVGGTARGGGVFSSGGSLALEMDTLDGNSAVGGNASASIEGSGVVFGPAAEGGNALGGGMYHLGTSSSSLDGVTVAGNVAEGGQAGGNGWIDPPLPGTARGGGLWLSGSDLDVYDSEISDNSCLAGYSVYEHCASPAYGGGLYLKGTCSVQRAWIEGNECVMADPSVTMPSDLWGGGVFIRSGVVSVVNSYLGGNRVQGLGGRQGAAVYSYPSLDFRHNTIAWNEGAPAVVAETSDLMNTIVYWNDEGAGVFGAEHCNVQGGSPGLGNIDEDPRFVALGDPHLGLWSPCINRGAETETPEDIDGESRPYAPSADIGADEIHVTPTPTPAAGLTYSVLMNAEVYEAGDPFLLQTRISNPGAPFIADEYLVLVAEGSYFFWPSWESEVDGVFGRTVDSEEAVVTILEFTWPEGAGSLDGLEFVGALLAPWSSEVVRMDSREFSYR